MATSLPTVKAVLPSSLIELTSGAELKFSKDTSATSRSPLLTVMLLEVNDVPLPSVWTFWTKAGVPLPPPPDAGAKASAAADQLLLAESVNVPLPDVEPLAIWYSIADAGFELPLPVAEPLAGSVH